MTQHRVAFVVLYLASLVWGFAFPVGVQRGSSGPFQLEDYDLGGRRINVVGELAYQAQGYGMPEGFFRYGTYSWGPLEVPTRPVPTPGGTYSSIGPFSASYAMLLASGHKPIPDTPELRAAIKASSGTSSYPDCPTGFFIEWRALWPSVIFSLVYFSLAFWWWRAVHRWTWRPQRSRMRNVLGLVGYAVALTLVATWTIWVKWRLVRELIPPTPALLPPEMLVATTAFALSLGAVALLCRKEWQRGIAE